MSIQAARTITATSQQPVQQATIQPTVAQLLEKSKSQIAAALPAHLKPDRMLRIALTEIRKNPELGSCDPLSFCGAIIQCAQLGLEPGSALGHAYLVPFWNSKKRQKEVQLIPGYRGLIDLSRRSGQIISISARVVYSNDVFHYEYGLEEKLVHIPARDDRGEFTCAYAVARLKDGGQQFEVMSKEEIDRIRDGGNKNPVWNDHYDEMARKTLVRRLFKYLPVSIEIANLIELSDQSDTGESQQNAQVLLDQGVEPWKFEGQSPADIDARSTKDSQEQQRLDVIDRIEKKIAAKIAAGGDPIDIESSIGMGLGQVSGLGIGQLMAVWELVK